MKILIVKTSALGDIIHAFPVLAYLKERFPHALIDWVVEKPFSPLLEAHSCINEVIPINTKEWRKNLFSSRHAISAFKRTLKKNRYDLVFDLQGNIKSGLITFLAEAPHKIGFGRKTVAESFNCLATTEQINPPLGDNIRNDYLYLVQHYLKDSTSFSLKFNKEEGMTDPFTIMVCPGSAWKNKQLKRETLEAFLQKIKEAYPCSFLFVWGDEKEKQWCEELHCHFPHHSIIVDKKPLPELQSMMKKMSLVIAMDSLPLHLAGTVGVSTFSIFGPSSAKKYAPEGDQHVAFQGSCPYGRTFEKRCPLLRTCPTGACMHDLSADALFQYFKSKVMLEGRS